MDPIGNYFRNNSIIKNGYWNLEITDPYFKKNYFIVNIEIKNLIDNKIAHINVNELFNITTNKKENIFFFKGFLINENENWKIYLTKYTNNVEELIFAGIISINIVTNNFEINGDWSSINLLNKGKFKFIPSNNQDILKIQ
jgi:hypothetical protein